MILDLAPNTTVDYPHETGCSALLVAAEYHNAGIVTLLADRGGVAQVQVTDALESFVESLPRG